MNNFIYNNVQFFKIAKLAIKYKGTSFSILTDLAKKKILNQKVPSFPRVVTLYVTNRCNLCCSMCLNASYRNKDKNINEINIKTIEKILPELIKYKPIVGISGGEPLLNKDVFKIISLLSKNKILTNMTTNGYLLEKYAQQIADSGLEFLSVSLDHYEEKKHDKGRGVKTTYKRLIKGINKIIKIRKKTPANIKVNTVIRDDNFGDLSKMYDFIESLGIDEWSIQHYSFINPLAQQRINKYKKISMTSGYTSENTIPTSSYLNIKQIQTLQEQLSDIIRKSFFYKTKVSIKPYINNIFSYYQGKFPSRKSECNYPFESINIMEGVKVTLCQGNCIGNLTKFTSIKEMWHSDKTLTFQKLILRKKISPLCFRCHGLKFNF